MIKESDNIQLELINTTNIEKGNTFVLIMKESKVQPKILDVDGFILYKNIYNPLPLWESLHIQANSMLPLT